MRRMSAQPVRIPRRIWQLLAVTAVVLVVTVGQYYPLRVQEGCRLWGSIFLIVFSLTYLREERRATRSPKSDLVINWNLAEAVLLFASLIGYFLWTAVRHVDAVLFHALFRTGTLGLLSGVMGGELFWQQTQLKTLDETCRQRYWATYHDSLL